MGASAPFLFDKNCLLTDNKNMKIFERIKKNFIIAISAVVILFAIQFILSLVLQTGFKGIGLKIIGSIIAFIVLLFIPFDKLSGHNENS